MFLSEESIKTKLKAGAMSNNFMQHKWRQQLLQF